ncbi:MFS general substrate transporter [Lichtheimia hyalospora FSU 10163]|nr:MFS general substrate transporter [Lichtheimia hyalospora FSU 10163]
MLIGTLISTVALVLASFATELWQLLLTQGLMFGIGLCIVFSTLATLPSQWFVKNRALANGIAWSGATLGPMACSNGFEALLTTFGRQITLAIMAGSVFILLLIAAILARPRYAVVHAPKDGAISPEKDSDKSLWSIRFMVILLSSFTYPFHWQAAFFLAPSYAQYLGASPSLAASTVTIAFTMTAISRIVFGFFADRYGRLNILLIAVFINAILFMTLWRYADTIVMFATFCGLLGVWGGLFANMRPVIISDLVGMKRAQKGVCLSYLLSVPACLVGDPLVSYIRLRYGWIIAIQTMGAFGLCSAIAILVVRFLMNKQLFVIV